MRVLIVVVLFYYTAVAQTYVDKTSKKPDVTVSVVAFKWNWMFQYPGESMPVPQGAKPEVVSTVGATDLIPVLVVPERKTIRFTEETRDVIHSFWVPDLLFKRDVVPGRTNSFEVTIEKKGAFVGRCAELCGTYHSNMNFEMRVVSWENYQKFLAAKKAGKSTPDALRAIGEKPYAVTTKPFNPNRPEAVL